MPSLVPLRSWCKSTSHLAFSTRVPLTRRFSTATPLLTRHAVAGSFIFKFSANDASKTPQVALFRRSGEVKTYPYVIPYTLCLLTSADEHSLQYETAHKLATLTVTSHKYAPISGSVEKTDANPLSTALREIQEETTLARPSITLFRHGKPYSFTDPSVGREWTINPFAFTLTPSAEADIKLDWEHESYAWFDPLAVSDAEDFGGVPKLKESLRRVWFDIDLGPAAGRVLREGLVALKQDHESDAREVVSKALRIFTDTLLLLDTSSSDMWWRNVRFAGWHLWKNGPESMSASILNAVVSSMAVIEKKLPGGNLPQGFVEGIIGEVQESAREQQFTSTEGTADDVRQRDHFFSDL